MLPQYQITELLPDSDYTITIETCSFESDPNGPGQITSTSSNSPSVTCQTGKVMQQQNKCTIIGLIFIIVGFHFEFTVVRLCKAGPRGRAR